MKIKTKINTHTHTSERTQKDFFPFKFKCISVGQAIICSHGSGNTRIQVYDNMITVETSERQREKEKREMMMMCQTKIKYSLSAYIQCFNEKCIRTQTHTHLEHTFINTEREIETHERAHG